MINLDAYQRLDERLDYLEDQVRQKLKDQGFKEEQIILEPFLHLRYQGTDCALMCTPKVGKNIDGLKHGDFFTSFVER